MLICISVFIASSAQATEDGWLDSWKPISAIESSGVVRGQSVRIRLSGIELPGWKCPSINVAEVLDKVAARVSGARLENGSQTQDGVVTGRIEIRIGDKAIDLGQALIRLGLAVATSNPGINELRRDYLLADDDARAEGIGYWKCASPLVVFDRVASASGVSPKTLYAIAMNESKRQGRPWPWTMNVSGKSYFFPTRESAWRMADSLIVRGVNTFDIGLMQVNWKYHGDRFSNVWEALQPSINQKVAADILLEKYRQTGHPLTAVGWYHNASPSRHRSYQVSFAKHFMSAVAN